MSPISHEQAIPAIMEELKTAAEKGEITVAVLDEDNRRKLAEWIFNNYCEV